MYPPKGGGNVWNYSYRTNQRWGTWRKESCCKNHNSQAYQNRDIYAIHDHDFVRDMNIDEPWFIRLMYEMIGGKI